MTNASTITPTLDTPMLKQYQEIKANYQDAILFFRLGDFYEMFLQDAKIASQELDLTLTGRGKNENRVPMCGIPYHAASSYISKLISKGFKVAICEQVEDPSLAKGLTKREVIKVITPGTILEESALDAKENNYLVAITLKNEIFNGSYVDSTTGEFVVFSAQNKSELLAHLDRLSAKEILIPYNLEITFPENILINHFEPTDPQRAQKELCEHFKIHNLSAFGIEELTNAYPAAWALIDYLKTTQKHSLAQITKINGHHATNYLFLDNVTRKNLELTESLYTQDKRGTLFWVLDHTKTAMGARFLKKLIKNPFVDPHVINERLDAIESLKNDLLSREEIREVLACVYDLERLLSRLVAEQNNPRDCIALKESLKSMQALGSILQHIEKSDILKQFTVFFQNLDLPHSPYSQVIDYIEKSIINDPPALTKDGEFIKEGFSEELDQLLLSFHAVKQWIQNLEELERTRTSIKSLKVGFTKVFGYYIEIPNSQHDKIPPDYIRKQTLANAERFITPELKEKESILLHGQSKQIELEQTLFKEIIQHLKNFIPDLQKLAEIISELDTFQSLATVAQKYNYNRPEFADQGHQIISIKKARHPVLEKNTEIRFIPNDLDMSAEQNRFILITGPNMAGKSTLMRQIALIVIMAQMGSFVPAESCTLSIVDKLFTRIGALDNLYVGHSTFMVEMLETATILNNATENSLIILDEIGRGTSTFDGMSIACAVSEHIYTQIKARTLFATHYHEITILEKKYPAFKNFNMKITENQQEIIFKYELIPGPADKSYGVHVAKMAGLPAPVIKKANELLKGFETEGIQYLDNKYKNTQLPLFPF